MSKFNDLMNSLAQVKNEAQELTKSFSENDDKIAPLVDNSVELLECSLDSCRNPCREVQKPITKLFTETIEKKEGDKLLNKVADSFNDYKRTYEESAEQVSELVNTCRQKYATLKAPVSDIMKETEACYTKYKEAIDNLTRPLQRIISGFEINEFRKKNFKDPEILKKFKTLLEQLQETFISYNSTSRKFNEETYNIFVKVENNNLAFSGYMEKEMLKHIQNIPKILNRAICLLPEVAREIRNAPPKEDDSRATYYDTCLVKLLEATKSIEVEREKAFNGIEMDMQNLKLKSTELVTEIQKNKENYKKYIADLKNYGEKICYIVDEIRKLFELDKMKTEKFTDVEYPFYEFSKKLNVVYDKLEETKEDVKPKLKLVMVALGKQLNKITIDMAFIMDITISMADLLDELRKSIKYIVDKIKKDSPGIDIRFAFEGYRDFADLAEGDTYISLDFTSDVDFFKDQLDKIIARGGGDDAEDVAGGLNTAINMTWKSNARYAVFIADAPGHGSKYHEPDVGDDYKDGDPNGLIFEDIVREYCRKNVNFNAVKIDTYTDIIFDIMSKIYKQEQGKNIDCFFEVVEYEDENGKKTSLKKNISKKAIEIYNTYCNKELLQS